jgi:hypothetical protein
MLAQKAIIGAIIVLVLYVTVLKPRETFFNLPMFGKGIKSVKVGKVISTKVSITPEQARCYLDRYPDLQDTFGEDNTDQAAKHYQDHGHKEGRDKECRTGGKPKEQPIHKVSSGIGKIVSGIKKAAESVKDHVEKAKIQTVAVSEPVPTSAHKQGPVPTPKQAPIPEPKPIKKSFFTRFFSFGF